MIAHGIGCFSFNSFYEVIKVWVLVTEAKLVDYIDNVSGAQLTDILPAFIVARC